MDVLWYMCASDGAYPRDPGMTLLEAYRFAKTVLPKLQVNRDLPRAKNFTWSTLFDRDLNARKASG